jgi:hypothetical protein
MGCNDEVRSDCKARVSADEVTEMIRLRPLHLTTTPYSGASCLVSQIRSLKSLTLVYTPAFDFNSACL